jgi:hypothetical protein
MEQRWGTRIDLHVPADIRTPEGLAIPAWVRNASLSGAFVETSVGFPLLSRLALRPLSGAGEWLDAKVVRLESTGMGIKWLEPELHAVAALLALRRDPSDAGAALRHGNVHPLFPQDRGSR